MRINGVTGQRIAAMQPLHRVYNKHGCMHVLEM